MAEILATPGPCPVPPEALSVLSEPVLHHRTAEFKSIFAEVSSALKKVFQTESDVLIHSATGSGAMESLIVNLHSPGDTVICITAGKFGTRWVELARAYGLKPLELAAPWGESPSPEKLELMLRENPQVKSVLTQACETSTGQKHSIRRYAEAVKSTEALLLVDAITALGAYDLPMDSWEIDGLIGGSQKAFMSLTGLSFVALSAKAWRAYENATLPKYYFDLGPERKAQSQGQTRFSSPVSLIKSLNVSLQLMLEGGLPLYWDRVLQRSKFCSEFIQLLGLKLFPGSPSPSLSVIELPSSLDGEAVQKTIQQKYKVVFMGGQDELKGRVLRWGHMGHQSAADQIQIATALALGLKDSGAQLPPEDQWRSWLEAMKVSESFGR